MIIIKNTNSLNPQVEACQQNITEKKKCIYINHRSEYTPLIFVNILFYLSCDDTEEMTLCYNVK